MNTEALLNEFLAIYGDTNEEQAEMFFAPGRVNLIGEHTDYNGGYVFPCALDFGTFLVIRKNNSRTMRFATTNFNQRGEISLDKAFEKTDNAWYNYPLGVVDQFYKNGKKIEGCDFLYSGDIPNEAGLSSSASIEVVTAFALNTMFNLGFDLLTLVKLSQKAENQFVGVNCGIMDQFAVSFGAKNKAIFLNCATLDYELVPLIMNGHKLIISNTNKKRGLADSKYNERRGECDTAVEKLSKAGKIDNLSQLNYPAFIKIMNIIDDETVAKRAKHVISENQRALDAVEALKANDLITFGRLMNESHNSLRDDYEVTGIELDTLVEEARKIPGVLGSRMTGAGFGGCTVSLVEESAIEDFTKKVGDNYLSRTGLQADFYVAEVGMGVHKMEM